MCKNYFCLLLNVHVVNNVGQTHTVEPLALVPSSSDKDIATEKLDLNHQDMTRLQQKWLCFI